jgi:AraC-like DNA-binding protein
MHGVTTQYRVDPRSEYVIGVASGRSFQATRGRVRRVVRPGELVVWDPSGAHVGSPAEGGPWEARLIVIELPDLSALSSDPDVARPDLEFPDPVVRDTVLTTGFLRLHRAMERPASALERESMLAAWLQDVVTSPTARQLPQQRAARRDVAVRRACECLRDSPTTNVTLDELAAAAGTSKFRLVRLFRAAFGVPPHVFQVGQRVAAARRLLERGAKPSEVAALVGFFDQSHLHRHFQPRLGMTPGQYANAFSHR